MTFNKYIRVTNAEYSYTELESLAEFVAMLVCFQACQYFICQLCLTKYWSMLYHVNEKKWKLIFSK